MNRRKFIGHSTMAAASSYLSTLPLAYTKDDVINLSILHTNDVHSRIDPFPMDGTRNEGKAGVARRKVLIDQLRDEKDNILLLDAGDMFQGTPYFNLFNGELEIKLMTRLGYDFATIGNHDFDAGVQNLADQMRHASFGLLCANYDCRNTPINQLVKPYAIKRYESVKVGIYGLGIELVGLVPKNLYEETQYLDPVRKAQEMETLLRKELKCDYVVCVSHLGFSYLENKHSDVNIAESTRYTDLIIGGHTHTFMNEPHIRKNLMGEPVIINQVGFAGLMLGHIDIVFERDRKRKKLSSYNIPV